MKINRTIAVVATAAAAGIHFAVAPEHFEEWWGLGLFFLVAGAAQLAWAAWPVSRIVGFSGNGLLVAIWAATRASGHEPVGALDAVTVVLELLAMNRIAASRESPASRQLQGDIA